MLNERFQNAGLNTSFESAGVTVISGYTEPTTDQPNALRTAYYADEMSNVLHLRNSLNADFTILVPNSMGSTAGSSGINQDAVGSHGLVEVAFGSIGVVSHEVGHLYGGHHTCMNGIALIDGCADAGVIQRGLFAVEQFRSTHATAASALPITTASTPERIHTNGEVDYFRFQTFATDGPFVIETTGSTDTVGTLYDKSMNLIETDDNDGAGSNFRISRNLARGMYFLKVAGKTSSTTGDYDLKLTGDVHYNALVPSHITLRNRCLDVQGSGTADGTQVIQWACTGNPNQQWVYKANGQLQVYADSDDPKCLGVSGAGTSNGSQVVLLDASAPDSNKLWQMRSDGTIRVYSGTSNEKCLEVKDGRTDIGTSSSNRATMQIYTCDPQNRPYQVFNR